MSKPTGDCCEACRRGETCEGKPACLRVFATAMVEPAIVPVESQPALVEFRHLYKPNFHPGLAAYLRSFSFVHANSVGTGVAVRLEVSFVPPDTDEATAELVQVRQVLVNQALGAPSPGVFTIVADREPGLVVPFRDDGKPWWLFMRVGTVAVPPTQTHSHSLQWGYQPIFHGTARC